ncbi:uncharacterized protein BT62DRAFT_936841 [Guyanagaster necrorhizus]|uniref:F-box domain-containing protein n=1 Tax=Guyanagaster necrorhizus TaxID=856835 RepID=A0A9P7VKN2_9AGAR|nr:uncharacterized protein BT62DRAFT_936841 [Guyanagaster necrorhizus MCA 3950]KAG7441716.1 hypothetical protein BT62DRAFT_936841 [Guyanagaster necrorhizus MCA 3950]
MLLSVPNEILNRIAFEADSRTRRHLRRTCQLLRDVATPLVFKSVYIDLSWSRHSSSASIFLKSLNSGPRLAQYIIRLSLYLDKESRPLPSRFASEARKKTRDERLDSFDALFLGAIPSMVSLKSLFWRILYHVLMRMLHQHLGDKRLLDHMRPNRIGFPQILWMKMERRADLDITLLVFIGIDAHVWCSGPDVDERGSISLLFSSLPTGTYSTVKTLSIGGEMFSELYACEIPKLISHLRHLESLTMHITIPDVFWDGLQEHGICLVSLTYYDPSLALLSYLSSYTGLRELSLNMLSASIDGNLHISSLLPTVITSNSSSLTTVHIEPHHGGAWCLDHPMLDALVLCRGLKSLHVCADETRVRVEENNVIDRILQASMTSWPNLWDLQIRVVPLADEAVKMATSQIHRRILALRFAPLPPERSRLQISTEFAAYAVKIHDRKNNIYAFEMQDLDYHGDKES